MAITTSIAPRYSVDASVPVAPRYNLFDAATLVDEGVPRWAGGIMSRGYPSGPVGVWIDPCNGGSGSAKTVSAMPTQAEFMPVTAYLQVVCPERGVDVADLTLRLGAAFAALAVIGVEHAVWVPTAGQGLTLADTAAESLNGGTAVGLRRALALLEERLTGGLGGTGTAAPNGVIHAPRRLASLWEGLGLLAPAGARLVTGLGTVVVAGSGYTGTGPNNAAPAAGRLWAYATGPVTYRDGGTVRIPDDVMEAIRSGADDNSVAFLAERDYLVAFDNAVHAAVNVDFTTEL